MLWFIKNVKSFVSRLRTFVKETFWVIIFVAYYFTYLILQRSICYSESRKYICCNMLFEALRFFKGDGIRKKMIYVNNLCRKGHCRNP